MIEPAPVREDDPLRRPIDHPARGRRGILPPSADREAEMDRRLAIGRHRARNLARDSKFRGSGTAASESWHPGPRIA